MCFRVVFFSTKLDPHRRPWRNVSIRDIVISSTVRSIDHCSASALLGPPSRARRLWFFFSSLIGDKTHSVMVLLSALSSICLCLLILSYSLPFFFLSLSGKRRERLGTRVRQALQPLSFHLSGLRALIMKQSLIIKSWLAFQIMQASIMCGNDTPMVTLKNPPIKMV